MQKINKFINKINNIPFLKKKNHPKDENPIEEVNEPPPENANENAISSGSTNNKNTLSSGSSQKTASPNPDDANNNDKNSQMYKAKSRAPYSRSTSKQRQTAPISFSQNNPVKSPSFNTNNKINPRLPFSNINYNEESVPERDVLSTFQNSFSERITINLPLDELNASSLRADVLLSMIKDKAELLDKSVTDTEKKMDEVSTQMKSIINKSRSITQTAAVINAKLVNIDDWIDRIGSDKSDFKINIVGFFVSLFSILTTILSLMWFSFRRPSIKGKKSI